MSKPLKKLTTKARKRLGSHYGPWLPDPLLCFVYGCATAVARSGVELCLLWNVPLCLILMGNLTEASDGPVDGGSGHLPHQRPLSRLPDGPHWILVCIGELFFRANGLYNGLAMFHKMVTQFSLACIRSGSLFQMGMRKKDFLLVAVFLVVLVLVGIAQERGVHLGTRLRQSPIALRVAVYLRRPPGLIIFALRCGLCAGGPIYAGF